MAAVDGRVEVLQQPDPGVAARRGTGVARELDEVEMVVDGDRARQVGDEEEAPLERPDQQRLPSAVVGGDLLPELRDARADLLRGQVDLADPVVDAGYEASSRRYRSARRSMSRL